MRRSLSISSCFALLALSGTGLHAQLPAGPSATPSLTPPPSAAPESSEQTAPASDESGHLSPAMASILISTGPKYTPPRASSSTTLAAEPVQIAADPTNPAPSASSALLTAPVATATTANTTINVGNATVFTAPVATPSRVLPDASSPANAPAISTETRLAEQAKNAILLPVVQVQEPGLPAFEDRELRTPQGSVDLAYQRHPGLKLGSYGNFKNDNVGLAMLDEEDAKDRRRETVDLANMATLGSSGLSLSIRRQIQESAMRTNGWSDRRGLYLQLHDSSIGSQH